MFRRPERPPRPWMALAYGACAAAQLGAAIMMAVDQKWLPVVYAATSSVAWLLLAVVQVRLELAWTLLTGLQAVVGLREREPELVYGVVRTHSPEAYLLHDQRTGQRWRLTPAGAWTREDW